MSIEFVTEAPASLPVPVPVGPSVDRFEAEVLIPVVMDCETTGLGERDPAGPRPDGVISVGLAWRDESRALRSMEFRANPGAKFFEGGRADGALKVNQFTIEQVRQFPDASEVAVLLKEELSHIESIMGGRVILLAYNAPFDYSFLTRDPWNLGNEWGPDLMARAQRAHRVPNSHYSLKAAMAVEGIEFDGEAHFADVDCRAEYRLMEALEERERNLLNENEAPLLQMAHDIADYVKHHQKAPVVPAEEGGVAPPTYVAASMLGTCLRKVWNETHGGPVDSWDEWSLTHGALGNDRESWVIEQMNAAGIRVADRQRFYMEKETQTGGKLDGRIEWPRDSGRWWPIEIKTSTKKLANTMADVWEKYLFQMEVYLRATGYPAGFFVFVGLGYGELGTWEMMPLERDDARWEKVKVRAALVRATREPGAPWPACSCGRCPP